MQYPIQLKRLTQAPKTVFYAEQTSRFGRLLSQWYLEGEQAILCGQQFLTPDEQIDTVLNQYWPNSQWQVASCPDQRWYQTLANDKQQVSFDTITVAVIASDLQWQVWQALLTIPFAERCSYSNIAQQIDKPSAVRAVASAIGQNRVAYLIPCHRVLRSDGQLGGFRWGLTIKQQLLDWEQGK